MRKSVTFLVILFGCLSLAASLFLSSPASATTSADEDRHEAYSETHNEVFSVPWQPHENSLLFMREGYIFTIQSEGSGWTPLTANHESKWRATLVLSNLVTGRSGHGLSHC